MTSISSTSSSTSTSTSSSTSIDWSALIEEAVNAKLAAKDTIEAKITKNEAKITAYQKVQSLLSDVADAAYALSAPTGTLAKNDDLFNKRSAYLTANGFSDASSVMGVSVANGTAVGTHDIKISQIATAQKVASTSVESKTTALNLTGDFTFSIDGKTATTISVSSTSTLADVASAINAKTSSTGVSAAILQVSSNSYQLVLSATDTGKAITVTSGTSVLESLGFAFDSGGHFTNNLQDAKNAIISIDGVQITRDSNTINDALSGVTLYLYAPTDTGDSVSVEVGADISKVSTGIQSLVTAYNAYRDFVVAQQATASDGTAASDAVLFGDITLRTANAQVMRVLSSAVDQSTMALLGLSFNASNHLELDSDTLNQALTTNLDAVESLLTFKMTTSSSDLLLLKRGTGAPTTFDLQINVDTSGTLTLSGDNASMFTIDDDVITGVEGTEYEGFSFFYTGTTSQTVAVTLSYGLADQIQAVASAAADTSEGPFQTLIDNLQDKDTKYSSEVTRIEERAADLRTQLTARYAKYQAALSQAETTLSYLQAMLDAANSNN